MFYSVNKDKGTRRAAWSALCESKRILFHHGPDAGAHGDHRCKDNKCNKQPFDHTAMVVPLFGRAFHGHFESLLEAEGAF